MNPNRTIVHDDDVVMQHDVCFPPTAHPEPATFGREKESLSLSRFRYKQGMTQWVSCGEREKETNSAARGSWQPTGDSWSWATAESPGLSLGHEVIFWEGLACLLFCDLNARFHGIRSLTRPTMSHGIHLNPDPRPGVAEPPTATVSQTSATQYRAGTTRTRTDKIWPIF
jgi:hypothetical protein